MKQHKTGSTLDPASARKRKHSLLSLANKLGCDTVAAFEPENVFYMTGFWGEAIAVCSTTDTSSGTKLISPKLESARAENDSVDCEIVRTERGSELLSSFVSEIENRKVCTDCSDYATIEAVRNEEGVKSFVVDSGTFFEARKEKDKHETAIIADASSILDRLFEICTERIEPGVSEQSLQATLVFEGMKLGANPPSYRSTLNPLIIAGGPNGALPHAQVSDRKFKKGDMIVVDLTLRHRGYIADATRTFALGSATEEMKQVYDIVLQSQKAGLDAAIDGAKCGDVDSACRSLIEEKGYGAKFIHSTGHGIGLDVHEPPWLRVKSNEVLRKGMTVTIEPGIYLEGKFGVRIEDSIIVDNKRPTVLNRFTKDLVII